MLLRPRISKLVTAVYKVYIDKTSGRSAGTGTPHPAAGLAFASASACSACDLVEIQGGE